MAIPSLKFCSLLLLIIFTYQAKAVYNEQGEFHYSCDQDNDRGNYTTNSTYHNNLNTLLSTIVSNTKIDYGFYNFSYGENTNKVNAIGLCRGDLKPNECRNCFNGSRANLTQLCPNRKEAIFWYEDERCMLRYSDRSIFNVMEDAPMFRSNNDNDSINVDLSNQVVTRLLEKLATRVASGDSRVKYAADKEPGPKYETIYGLVQCTPDLSMAACNSCLVESLEQIPGCCKNKIGGRVVKPSCNMRFETSYLFYTPIATPPPPPPPPPATTTNNTSSGTCCNSLLF